MTRPTVFRAHAKVNLGLDVLGTRPDGYHEIRTVLQSIALCDDLHVEPAPELTFTCSETALGPPEDNLVMRAARLLREAFGGPAQGAKIHLLKRTPAQAGLGGGSSDAAMALLALAQLWKLPSSPADLLPLAARLGSDVPFFLTGGTALGIGRGEEVYALPDAPPLSVLIVVPGRGMPTVEAYARLDQRLTGPISLHRMTTLVHGIVDGRLGEGLLYNVFEEVQPHEEGEVAALRRVSAGMGKGRLLLAGSGSAWVALFSNHEDAREAGRRLSRRGVKGILTQSLARRDYWERSLPATAKEFRP